MGTDIYTEYQYYSIAAAQGFWNYAIPNSVNACLSIVILGPAYSQIMDISGIWLFKAIYPLLFSLVPVIIFRFLRIQIGGLRSFLAVFLFMAMPTFSLEMIGLCRQQIAELFLALFILLLVDRRIKAGPKLAMLIMFSVSIAVSHYSVGFISLIYAALLPLLVLLFKTRIFRTMWSWITKKWGGLPETINEPGSGAVSLWIIGIPVIIYYVAAFLWYWLVASGVNLSMLSYLWISQSGSATHMFAGAPQDPFVRAALGYDFVSASIPGKLFRILQYLTQLFIIAGFIRLLIAPKGLRFRVEYIALSLTSVALLAACVLLPNFAAALNTTRWYHIVLITLAPFFVLGAEYCWMGVDAALNKSRKSTTLARSCDYNPAALKLVTAAVLVPYFLFTSGLIYEIVHDQNTTSIDIPYSFSLSSYRLDLTGVFNRQDAAASGWLSGQAYGSKIPIYCDINTTKLFLPQSNGLSLYTYGSHTAPEMPSYLFLDTWNLNTGTLAFPTRSTHNGPWIPGLRDYDRIADTLGVSNTMAGCNLLYNNGGSRVYYVSPVSKPPTEK
jgi:uncharacterized membrane protein